MKFGSYESPDVVVQVIVNRDDMSAELKAAITMDLQNAFCNIYNNILREKNNVEIQIMDVIGIQPIPKFVVEGLKNVFDEPKETIK